MLDSASGYECLDMTGLDWAITGNIMPKRDAQKDGSWRAMKYEDLLFLKEAYQERLQASYSVVRGGGGGGYFPYKQEPPGRMLSLEKFTKATQVDYDCIYGHEKNGFYANIGHYIRDDISLDDVFDVTEVLGFVDFKELKNEFPGEWERPSRTGQLKADDIRQAFYDLKYFRRTYWPPIILSYWFRYSGNGVLYYDDPDQEDEPYTDSGTTAGGTIYSVSPSRYYRCTYTYINGSSPIDGTHKVLWVKDVWWAIRVYISFYMSPGDSSTTKSFLVFRPCGKSPTSPNVSDIARWACGKVGCPYSDDPYKSESERVSVSVSISYIVEHDFPSDFSDIEWDWEPS